MNRGMLLVFAAFAFLVEHWQIVVLALALLIACWALSRVIRHAKSKERFADSEENAIEAIRQRKEKERRLIEKQRKIFAERDERARDAKPAAQAQTASIASSWGWSSAEPGRLAKAKLLQCHTLSQEPFVKAEFVSQTTGEVYTTTLRSCTCHDFAIRSHGKFACKHMLALALKTGVIAVDGTPKANADLNHKDSPTAIFSGLSISFTGAMKHMSQHELESYIRQQGGKAALSFNSSVNLLILGKNPSAKTIAAAASRKVDMMLEEDFYQKYQIPLQKAKKEAAPKSNAAVFQIAANQQKYESEKPSLAMLEDLLTYLDKRHIKWVDKRSVGGCLWIASCPESDALLPALQYEGCKFSKAAKSRQFHGESAWYLRS